MRPAPPALRTQTAATSASVLMLAGWMVAPRCAADEPRAAPASATSWRFAFGPGPAPPSFTRVAPDAVYSKETGHGFEPGAKVAAVERGGLGYCKGDAPFFFSIAVPEGNYRVTVAPGPSPTTVKAELRRLMLEPSKARAPAGGPPSRSFTVNVRQPAIADTGRRVRLKAPRETTDEAWAWDDKLTLEFNGAPASLASLSIEKVDTPTVFLLGDSTVCDQSREPYASWGQMLPRFFKPGVAVANHAESGESLRSSAGALRLEKVLSLLKNGDYLLIQFGHNDMKSKEPDAPEVYRATLTDWVRQARARGAVPVLITPMNRHSFEGETVVNSLGPYPEMVRRAAAETKAPLIDLNALSKVLYEALGPRKSIALFKRDPGGTAFDRTHHSPFGAYELAACVALGLRQSTPDLAPLLADDLPPFDPAHPDPPDEFHIPPSPHVTTRRPLGD